MGDDFEVWCARPACSSPTSPAVRAHAEFFADSPPATTMVEVKALIEPDMLIEIEAEAVCPG